MWYKLGSRIYLSREGGSGERFQGLRRESAIELKHNTNICVFVFLCFCVSVCVSVFLCFCVSVFVTSDSWNRAYLHLDSCTSRPIPGKASRSADWNRFLWFRGFDYFEISNATELIEQKGKMERDVPTNCNDDSY
jgi:hypothetical protein